MNCLGFRTQDTRLQLNLHRAGGVVAEDVYNSHCDGVVFAGGQGVGSSRGDDTDVAAVAPSGLTPAD